MEEAPGDQLAGLRERLQGRIATRFQQILERDDIKTVLVCGCGGGFDFVHSMLLMPTLRKLGKKLVWLSYSFGVTHNLRDAPIAYENAPEGPYCKLVNGTSTAWAQYRPEVGFCSFLDALLPAEAPHSMYACYAREWSIVTLSKLYAHLVDKHSVDAILMLDGGSDSLMRGDEKDLGDPIEDAVSIGAAANCNVKAKLLVSVGLGSDRFNGVSDCSTLRAVAELTKMGGFLGCSSFDDVGFECYRAAIKHIYEQQTFRSVLTSLIISAGKGDYAFVIPEDAGGRVVREGQAFVWPLMAMYWCFDIECVAKRSMIVQWLRPCVTVKECHRALDVGRASVPILGEENFPLHADMTSF